MKTGHLLSNVFSFVFLITIVTFVGCGGPDIEGCTNGFATNYDSSATINCCCSCCEYNINSKINELVGSYEISNKDFGPFTGSLSSQVLIKRQSGSNIGITVKGGWFSEMSGSFNNGVFNLKSDVHKSIFGCNGQTSGKIYYEENRLIMEVEDRSWGTSNLPNASSCASLNSGSKGELIKL